MWNPLPKSQPLDLSQLDDQQHSSGKKSRKPFLPGPTGTPRRKPSTTSSLPSRRRILRQRHITIWACCWYGRKKLKQRRGRLICCWINFPRPPVKAGFHFSLSAIPMARTGAGFEKSERLFDRTRFVLLERRLASGSADAVLPGLRAEVGNDFKMAAPLE